MSPPTLLAIVATQPGASFLALPPSSRVLRTPDHISNFQAKILAPQAGIGHHQPTREPLHGPCSGQPSQPGLQGQVQSRGIARPPSGAFRVSAGQAPGRGGQAPAQMAPRGQPGPAHQRGSPGLPGRRSRQFTARRRDIYTLGWRAPLHGVHVPGLHPPRPAPSSYFRSSEESAAGPCSSCDGDTGHSEDSTELF